MGRIGKDALTPEEAPGYNSPNRKKLATIWRRIEYLNDRIARSDEERPWRDKQEVEALIWILEQAGAPTPPRPNAS